jgi:hypothetical protein
MENKNQEKELDLLDLLAIFWNFFKSYFFKPLCLVIKICFKRWYVLFAAVLLGIVMSIVVPKFIITKYNAEIILKNNVAISTSYIKEIEGLSEMNRGRLATILQLDNETLKSLVQLRPHRVISVDSTLINYTVDKEDVTKGENHKYKIHPSMLALEVMAKDTASLSIFADAVINYLNERSSFSILNDRRISSMKSELKTYQKEIEVLDSLRHIQYFTSDANQVVLGTSGETFNIKDKNQWIQSDLMNLKSRVISLETKLESDTLAVEKVTSLMISDIYNNHPIKTAPKYCIFFFVLAFISVLYLEYKGNIKEWLKK